MGLTPGGGGTVRNEIIRIIGKIRNAAAIYIYTRSIHIGISKA